MTEPTTAREMPPEIGKRVAYHGDQAAYHRRLQRELGCDYAALESWADLRETFPLTTDEHLRNLDPQTLVPDEYTTSELVASRSSGTTGEPKTVYWHPADIEANVDALVAAFDADAIPRGARWVTTATPNPVLKETLRGLAARFDGTVLVIEINPEPIKRALASDDEARIAEALSEPAKRVQEALRETEAAVYEDIAPLMAHVGAALPPSVKRNVECLFIGGVGTTANVVQNLTERAFPNAALAGWYGDYMNGFSPMRTLATLEYRSPHPDVRFDVVDPEDVTRLVAPGERGAVVSHAIRRGFFVPNRWVGDSARRIIVDGIDGLADIERLDTSPPTNNLDG